MKRNILMVLGFFTILVFAPLALCADIQPLDTKEATKIIKAKGYSDIVIGVIVEEATLLGCGGSNTALVMAIAKKNGKSVKLEDQLFVYDRKVGWCDADIVLNEKTKEYTILLYTAKGITKLTHK